jgi:ABC-type transport system involved in multi-copper enzyme maturation permease subunit
MGLTAGNLALCGLFVTWLRPLWMVALGAAVVVAGLLAVSFLLRLTAAKVSAIARTTAKEALSQPLFYVILAIGVVLLAFIFPLVPYNTFGEDIKMLKAEGLTLIKLLAIILAVWTASVSIAEEIEGRTALTLLSKPVNRRQLVFGKFLGILGPVLILFVIFGAVFLASISYKVVYDARESAMPEPKSEECYAEMAKMVPGLVLSFQEAVVLTAISVAISTRLPMLANMVICVSIYVLGHLIPVMVSVSTGRFEVVSFIGRLSSAGLPVLDYFNMETAISTGQPVPLAYLGWTGLYCVLLTVLAMLVALLLFEDRDLA